MVDLGSSVHGMGGCMYAIFGETTQSYCLSLHGSSLWALSSPALHNIEVTLNKILRKIWHLHYRSHTAIVHLVAKLDSLFNVVYHRSNSLLFSASKCPSILVRAVFRDSATVCYSFSGYNKLFGVSHIKTYDKQYQLCANVIRAIRCCSSVDNNNNNNR